jgi:hypothetical protein
MARIAESGQGTVRGHFAAAAFDGRPSQGARMTSDLEAAAQELRTAGLSYQAIADELGVSKKSAGRFVNGPEWGRGSSSSSGAGGNYRADEWSGPTEAGERTAADYVAIILAAMAVGTLALEAFRWWRRRHPSDDDQ